ncbi:hypothetical protein D3C85_1462090 [compost metagenome]
MLVEDHEELDAIVVGKLVVAVADLLDQIFKALGILELLDFLGIGVGVLNCYFRVVESNLVGDVDHQLFWDHSGLEDQWIENERDLSTSFC